MTSYYNQIPSFEEQVRAASLVIVGRVRGMTGEKTDYYNDQPQLKRIYQVAVSEVLKGRLAEKTIEVQVAAGNQPEHLAALSPAQMKEGEQIVMFLAPNYGPQRTANQYVPYFQSLFPVSRDGEVTLSEPMALGAAQRSKSVQGAVVKLDDLRDAISGIAREQEAEAEMQLKAEPLELREAPEREILEMPPRQAGGPRSAEPGKE